MKRCESLQSRCEPLWIVAKPPQRIYHEYILKDRSRKSGFYGWQLFPRTVALSAVACVMPDFCCWVLLSSITGFIISKVTQTNSANQNLHGRKFGSLPCRITLQTPGADPGEVKRVNFHPPFSEPPSFYYFFLSLKYWLVLIHYYKNSPPISKSWIRAWI